MKAAVTIAIIAVTLVSGFICAIVGGAMTISLVAAGLHYLVGG